MVIFILTFTFAYQFKGLFIFCYITVRNRGGDHVTSTCSTFKIAIFQVRNPRTIPILPPMIPKECTRCGKTETEQGRIPNGSLKRGRPRREKEMSIGRVVPFGWHSFRFCIGNSDGVIIWRVSRSIWPHFATENVCRSTFSVPRRNRRMDLPLAGSSFDYIFTIFFFCDASKLFRYYDNNSL